MPPLASTIDLRRHPWKPVAIILCLYLLLTVPLAVTPFQNLWAGYGLLCLYTLLASDLAVRLTESLLAFSWSPETVPVAADPLPCREVAVVMTVCNDASPLHIRRLATLREAGHDVYLLDDSTPSHSLPLSLGDKIR